MEKTSFKSEHVLQRSLQWYLQYSRYRPKKKSINRLNLKEMWHIYTEGNYSDMKNYH